MIPRIRRYKGEVWKDFKYEVVGFIGSDNKDTDLVRTFTDAIRLWLYHCHVPIRICFWEWKKRK